MRNQTAARRSWVKWSVQVSYEDDDIYDTKDDTGDDNDIDNDDHDDDDDDDDHDDNDR